MRCWWAGTDPAYVAYHDEEWGRARKDERELFECLSLESFQSGLSWLTILRKRDAFREVFHEFAVERVAAMTVDDIDRLLADTRIVRHRGKIEATIANASGVLALRASHGGLAEFLKGYRAEPADRPKTFDPRGFGALGVPEVAKRLSKDLKALGYRFVGPTTIYAFMEATGMVDNHVDGCWCRGSGG